jgi:UDP-N-acetylmuramoylalanine--D-glutamate ligase
LLTELPDIDPRDLVVLEMSNAQLEDLPRIPWMPNAAVITNLYPHHLDRYTRFAEYIEAKLNIARAPTGKGPLITGPLHDEVEPLLEKAVDASRRVRVTALHPLAELYVPGEHNQANAACVVTVTRVMGLDEGFVREALRTFRGLPHRLEFVRTIGGVDYFNDSKSTAPPATVVAVRSMSRRLVTIVGGQKKDVPLTTMVESLRERCRAVVCMGESGPVFAEAIRAASPSTVVRVVERLNEAVPLATTLAQSGDAVLFSPGAPSFDQYGNFTERGRDFIERVNAL